MGEGVEDNDGGVISLSPFMGGVCFTMIFEDHERREYWLSKRDFVTMLSSLVL